ncbi:MAG TPA: hypothetical protein VK162_07795 [Streptosporangiaceae bacterium]|nr:hypothetical protein [Streptosporangiaceae bacterium]
MAKVYAQLDERLTKFIVAQPIFFVAQPIFVVQPIFFVATAPGRPR